MARDKFVQIENKNALLELLEEGRPIGKIYLANNAYKDPKTEKIVALANQMGILIEKIARKGISRRSKSSSHESVIGLMHIDNMFTLDEMLEQIESRGEDPFILIFSDIKYPQNIAAIFRTAFAAGVNGVITPIQKGNLLSDEVIRISMGTCLRIPIAEMNLFEALNTLKAHAVEVMVLDMDGESLYETEMVGPKALILGSEYEGASPKLIERADKIVSIPMKEGLGSLNVGVSASLAMYEKSRQETILKRMKAEGHPLAN